MNGYDIIASADGSPHFDNLSGVDGRSSVAQLNAQLALAVVGMSNWEMEIVRKTSWSIWKTTRKDFESVVETKSPVVCSRGLRIGSAAETMVHSRLIVDLSVTWFGRGGSDSTMV